MSFQLRHRQFGVYQGQFLGLGFWWPESDMPEQGFCEFPTEQDALNFRHYLLVESTTPLNDEDLTVEPFDREESERLIRTAAQSPANG